MARVVLQFDNHAQRQAGGPDQIGMDEGVMQEIGLRAGAAGPKFAGQFGPSAQRRPLAPSGCLDPRHGRFPDIHRGKGDADVRAVLRRGL